MINIKLINFQLCKEINLLEKIQIFFTKLGTNVILFPFLAKLFYIQWLLYTFEHTF